MAKIAETLVLRAFAAAKIPLISFCSPTVVDRTEDKIVIKIPLRRRTKNHLGSMYFGVLAVGADCAGGLLAMELIRRSGQKVSLVFKDFKVDFLKRPEHDVHFTCSDGPVIRDLVQRTLQSKKRENATVRVIATCPRMSGDEPVADCLLTLSLKAS